MITHKKNIIFCVDLLYNFVALPYVEVFCFALIIFFFCMQVIFLFKRIFLFNFFYFSLKKNSQKENPCFIDWLIEPKPSIGPIDRINFYLAAV